MKNLWKMFLWAYIIIFTAIFIGGLFFNKSQIMYADFLPLIISTVIFLVFWLFVYKIFINKTKEISKKKEIIIFSIISIIIIILECLYGYYLLNDGSGWDMYVVLRAAKDIANGTQLHYDDHIYFQITMTNRFITILLSYVFKLFNFLNITNEYLPYVLVNILAIYISFATLYFIIRKLYNKKLAIFMFASCIFLTPIFLCTSIAYTDIMSMPFILLAILIYLKFKECDKTSKKVLLTILLSIIIFIGCQLKMTVMFVGVGILIDTIINGLFKKYWKYILLFLILIVIHSTTYHLFLDKKNFFDFDIDNKELYTPYEVYILFGVGETKNDYINGKTWYGVWNQKDILYVLTGDENYQDSWISYDSVRMYLYKESPHTYEQKQELARKRIIEKLENYGILGSIKHFYFKSVAVFADGTYYIPLKVSIGSIQKNNIFFDIFQLNGKYFDIYFYIAQGIHMVIILLSIISTYISYKNNEKKNIIFIVSLICLFIFMLIWEARSRYILNYSLLFFILACNSLDKFKDKSLKQLINDKNI